MRLTYPYQTDRLGAVRIYGLQRVFELESGTSKEESAASWGTTVYQVVPSSLRSVHRRMAIVVPCKNERAKLVEGVLAGIPHDCLLIFVSNSDRDPVDRYEMERDIIERFCRFNQRPGLIIHQRDPGLAEAMTAAGMPELIDSSGLVREGKGEGMIVAMALAYLAGRDYVGFIDADNYVPGSVSEYVNAFAANFALSQTAHTMVRINWQSKPKVMDGSLFFSKHGRVSESTNRYINLLLSHLTGFGTEAIRTGNAGEHAMTMSLALQLRFAGGFAIEPAEVVELLERFGGLESELPYSDMEIIREGVEMFQVETLNPHFHEEKGDEHVDEMRHTALATIHSSALCPPWLREEIELELEHSNVEDVAGVLGSTRRYPPLAGLDWPRLVDWLKARSKSIQQFGLPEEGPDLLEGFLGAELP